jgi:hypothetical protein
MPNCPEPQTEIPDSPKRPRTPGSMAGKIHIAPDFETLPDDMAEASGVIEPRSC